MRPFLMLFYFLLILIESGATDLSDSATVVVKDLQHEWLIFQGGSYIPYDRQPVNAIYFELDAAAYRNDLLFFRSVSEFQVFLNKKLILQQDKGIVRLSLDSLRQIYSSSLSFAVFQKKGIQTFESKIVASAPTALITFGALIPRKGNFFLNFVLLATLILSVYFVLLFRTNPRLTLDYLNVYKLLSVQEREENLLATRVASSVNLLFYLFCSACCSLMLLTIFYFGANETGAGYYFPIRTTGEGFLQWGKLSLIIAGGLALKLLVITLFSNLFGLKDTGALQFFNFIRALFFIVGLTAAICTCYFVYFGYPVGPDNILLKMGILILGFSAVMIFLKLLTLAHFSFFHLFSYLCASEIIPLVILLKVLLS